MEISTSVLSVEEENSAHTFYRLEVAHTDYFHIDVMDGKFVERDTVELMQKYADNLKNITNIPLDVHLMVQDVKKYVDNFSSCSPRNVYFHIEAIKDKKQVLEMIKYIKDLNCKVGLVISPETNASEIYEYLPYIHNVLVMTVVPGKGGQDLIPDTIDKIRGIRKYAKENDIDIEIEADGGINISNIKMINDAGADIAVVGSYIINSKDYKYTISKLKEI